MIWKQEYIDEIFSLETRIKKLKLALAEIHEIALDKGNSSIIWDQVYFLSQPETEKDL